MKNRQSEHPKKEEKTPRSRNRHLENQLLDSSEVKILLKVSDSTLARYRKKNEIIHTRIGGKIFYPAKQFNNLIKELTKGYRK